MALHTQLCIVLFGTCLFSILLLLECKKLEGYAFPVYSTNVCPRNQAEWNNRSSDINCTERHGYMCLPNENLTELLEFCYIYPRILVDKDLCLFLDKRFSKVISYNCRKFTHGCPELNYFSSDTFIYPSCIEIENGCFSAEPSCKRQPLQSENTMDDTTLAIVLGLSIPICMLCILVFYVIRKKLCVDNRPNEACKDRLVQDKTIIDEWKIEDEKFISTRACEEVEKMIESRNLVIVAGHSGSGKSAIIHHIALKYWKKGWAVRQVKQIEDIVNEYRSSTFRKKTMCVFDDKLGKECITSKKFNSSLQKYKKKIKLYLKSAKILMSCRNYIISDYNSPRYLVNHSHIINIEDNKYKLSVEEKRKMLDTYTSPDINLFKEECDEIVEVERYFPLLCKLYSSNEEYQKMGKGFFTEPVTVLKDEVTELKINDIGKYCALVLLVVFNDDLCVNVFLENKDEDKKNKFKHALKLCRFLPEETKPSYIVDNLNSLNDYFVKTNDHMYHFYDDSVMDATTHVFGTEYPAEMIKYADIGFLRRNVRLENGDVQNGPLTIIIKEKYIEELGGRLYTELFGERLLDVVLNPCLRNEEVVEVLKKKIKENPENRQMLLKPQSFTIDKQECAWASKHSFLNLENKVSPLFALIVFCHTQLSLYCLNTLQQMQHDLTSCFAAVCCNGSEELFSIFLKNHTLSKEFLKKTWGRLRPIHIVSVFHNYELLNELIKKGADVNKKVDEYDGLTPYMLAARNDTQEYGDSYHRKLGATRRENTLKLLLNNGADINLCKEGGV